MGILTSGPVPRQGCYGGRVGFRIFAALVLLLSPDVLLAASPDEEQIPPLNPPRGLIPAGFWELYGVWVILGSVLLLLMIAGVTWLLLRPRPPVLVPPAVQARNALERLRSEPPTGAQLSRVSQIVRSYFTAGFSLPPAELTTTEFCRILETATEVAPDLASKTTAFLRECDQRKFALAHPSAPMDAISQARQLIDDAEAQRPRLRAAANDGPGNRPGQSPATALAKTGKSAS